MSGSEMNLNRRTFVQAAVAGCMSAGAWLPVMGEAGPAPNGELLVDLQAPAEMFNRMVFGQFLEHFHRQVYGGIFEPGSPLADRNGFRLDVIEALKELRVPIVRWPGGCFVSAYHWRDGVGKDRKPSFNKAWGVEEPNTFGTDEFIEWCRLVGTEPYLCTNAGTGTEEEMSDWVEYCNLPTQGSNAKLRIANGHEGPYYVKYWSIGNENYLGGEIGGKTVEEWGPLVRESAKMMRSVDSTIEILAAATVTGDWTPPLLKAAGRYLNYISIHGYWDPLWGQDTHPSPYLKCMSYCEQPEQQIKQAIDLLQTNGFGDKVKIAFDEWNLRGWHHPGFPSGGADRLDLIKMRDENDQNEIYTMADAVFSASFLNGCLRNAKHVQMACMAPVVNVRGPLYVHPKGIVKRTTFHVMKMYSDLLESMVVPGRVESGSLTTGDGTIPVLDSVTTRSADGRRLAVALVNRHPSLPQQCSLQVDGRKEHPSGRMTTLAGKTPESYNGVERPNEVVPQTAAIPAGSGLITLPPHSISVVQFTM